MVGSRTSSRGGSRLMSPRHLKHANQGRWGAFLAFGALYYQLGSPSDRSGHPAASSCNRAPARILEFACMWRRGGGGSCVARTFSMAGGRLPSGDFQFGAWREYLQHAKKIPLSPSRFDEYNLTAAVDRPSSWSSFRTREYLILRTNNVTLIGPLCADSKYWCASHAHT